MRKITAALIGTVLAATALAGCSPAPGTSNSSGCTPAERGDGSVLGSVAVDGAIGEQPKITVPTAATPTPAPSAGADDQPATPTVALTVTHPEREEVITGEGRQVTSLNQVVAIELTLINSADGSVLSATEYAGAPGYVPLGSAVQAISTFGQAVMCAHEGSRIVAAFPSTDLDPSTVAGIGLGEAGGIIAVIDVIEAMRPAADGTPVFNAAPGMPSVIRTPSGTPGVSVPTAPAPEKITVQTLLEGDGEEVTGDVQAVVNVLGTTWEPSEGTAARTTFVNTWETSLPQVVSLEDPAALPTGFAEAIEGATVGSQLLLVVPATENVAAEGSTTPVGASLVYVIDIVGAL